MAIFNSYVKLPEGVYIYINSSLISQQPPGPGFVPIGFFAKELMRALKPITDAVS